MRARVVAVTNQKGGVGKTTTTINLAASLAVADQKVLLVDVDPQANLTSGVGLRGQAGSAGTIYDALTTNGAAPHPANFILPTGVDGLFAIPANRNLTGAEIELVSLPEREQRLRRFLAPLRHEFDSIFIDCPPSLGLLTLNALVAADAVLIPLHCEYFALEGLADLVATLRRVRGSLNPSLDIDGVLLTMHDEPKRIFQALEAGASGYLIKPVAPASLLEAISEVRQGGSPMSSPIARLVIRTFHQRGSNNAQLKSLTPREDEILKFLAQGLHTSEIAAALKISKRTVGSHLHHIYEKLHVASRSQAVAKFFGSIGVGAE